MSFVFAFIASQLPVACAGRGGVLIRGGCLISSILRCRGQGALRAVEL